MSFTIFTDTSANLPTPMVNALGIHVIPLSYSIDGKTCESLDTESFDYAAYYDDLKNGAKISTSQINPAIYTQYMEPVLKAGNDILLVSMSSGISGTYSSAVIAREQLLESYPERSIRLVDSLGASLGEGLLVLQANRCKEQGMSLDETAEYLLNARHKIYQLFTVDDLMHLRKGGRLSNAVALLGTLLNIKPILKGDENGKIVSFEKVRGRKAVISQIAQRYDRLVADPENQTVGISHCNCREEAELLAAQLKRNHPPLDILIVDHEPVTGSYLGPGALAVYFTGEQGVRQK